MLVAQLHRRIPTSPNLASGVTVPRGSTMHGVKGADDPTACEFRTAHDVTLWPIEIVSASYFSLRAGSAARRRCRSAQRIKGGLRIRLKTTAGAEVLADWRSTA